MKDITKLCIPVFSIAHTCMALVIDNPSNAGLRMSLFKTANNATPKTIRDAMNSAQNANHLQLKFFNLGYYI